MTAADDKEDSVPGTTDTTGTTGTTGTGMPARSVDGSRTGPWAQARSSAASQLSGRARAWYLRAAEHNGGGRPDRAAELLVSAVRLEPSAGCLREALARAQYDAKQYLAARTTFTAMAAIDPGDHYALYGLGLVESSLGEYDAAASHLELAVRLRPGDRRYAAALEHARAAAGPAAADDPAEDVRSGRPGAGGAGRSGRWPS